LKRQAILQDLTLFFPLFLHSPKHEKQQYVVFAGTLRHNIWPLPVRSLLKARQENTGEKR